MTTYLMQAVSSTSGLIYGWQSSTPDFTGTGFTGPGSPQHIAVAGRTLGGAGVQISKFPNDLSPFALWNFEGTTADTSGNGRDLTYTGTPTYIHIYPGLQGILIPTGGVTLTRSDQNFNIKGDHTILAMVQANSYTALQVLAFGASGESLATNFQYNFQIYLGGGMNLGFQAGHEQGNSGETNIDYASGSNTLPYIHNLVEVGCVKAGGRFQFWANAHKVGAQSSVLGDPTGGTSAFLQVGATGDAAIGGIKFWNRALSDAEVISQFNSTMGGTFGTV